MLQESSDYLECILNSLPDAVFSIKMPERVIEWANDTYYVFGYAPDEFRGKTTEFLYPDIKDYLEAGKKIEKEIADGKEVFGVEWILRKKSGELFPAEIKLSFFRVEGKVIRITAIVRNIADRKRVEQKIQNYQERLKALAFQLTLTAEKERRAVAVDLHDRIGPFPCTGQNAIETHSGNKIGTGEEYSGKRYFQHSFNILSGHEKFDFRVEFTLNE